MGKARILIVEDEIAIAEELKDRLITAGYEVPARTATGEKAVELAGEIDPDLVLMDINLEGEMNGIQAAEQIRSRQNIPIVFITAYSDEETLQRAKITEPYGFIVKPFDDRELHINVEISLYKAAMERKLREREAWLSTTLRSIGDAVISTDHKAIVTFINPVAESLTGWNAENAVGMALDEILILEDEKTGRRVDNLIERILQEKQVAFLKNHILTSRDGRRIPIDDSAAPIKNEAGSIYGVVIVFRDITEKRAAERAIEKAKNELEKRVELRTRELTETLKMLRDQITERKKAQGEKERIQAQLFQSQKMEAIGNLAGGIAHDFNNVLGAIIGYSDLSLSDKRFPTCPAQEVEKIKKIAEAAKSLTSQLLAFSRKQNIELETVNLNRIFNDMGGLLDRLIKGNIRLTADLEQNIWPAKADSGQLKQVIMNLVINARDALPDGGDIQVTTRNAFISEEDAGREPRARRGRHICLSIRDNGSGIDETMLDRIFEPFFTTKERSKGTGLGLSVVYGIVKKHGGWIEVKTKINQGTVFDVYLPAIEEHPVNVASQQ